MNDKYTIPFGSYMHYIGILTCSYSTCDHIIGILTQRKWCLNDEVVWSIFEQRVYFSTHKLHKDCLVINLCNEKLLFYSVQFFGPFGADQSCFRKINHLILLHIIESPKKSETSFCWQAFNLMSFYCASAFGNLIHIVLSTTQYLQPTVQTKGDILLYMSNMKQRWRMPEHADSPSR